MNLSTLIKQLYAVDTLEGYTEEEINKLKVMYGALPAMLEEFYCTAGQTAALWHVQDIWITPEHRKKWVWLQENSHFILLNENQGVCRAGIRRSDMTLSDPPVYVTMNDTDWKLCAPTTSEFLAAALAYEAVFAFDHCSEDIYWLSEEDLSVVQSSLIKLPFVLQNWMVFSITCYNNAPDNLAVVLDFGGEYQMLYGGATVESYNKLHSVLKNLGEPV